MRQLSYMLLLYTAVSAGLVLKDMDATSTEEACRRSPHLPLCELSQNATNSQTKRDDEEKRRRQELIDRVNLCLLCKTTTESKVSEGEPVNVSYHLLRGRERINWLTVEGLMCAHVSHCE